jgi:peptidoglycan hydrolase-like protein with peptidoglycan-binding domain
MVVNIPSPGRVGAPRTSTPPTMRKILFFVLVSLAALGPLAQADETTREMQQALKDLGFYYGEVDGAPGEETTAAIRRYQIRNGLEVTGTLTEETVKSLRSAGKDVPETATRRTVPPPPASDESDTADLRNDNPPAAEADREFLRKETEKRRVPPPVSPDEEGQTAPAPLTPRTPLPATGYRQIFLNTPYENAPPAVQEETVRRAQAWLLREGFYHGAPDGVPGPNTFGALAEFQEEEGIAQTGRLDLPTLSRLGLLPGRHVYRGRRTMVVEPPRRVYRGIWVR